MYGLVLIVALAIGQAAELEPMGLNSARALIGVESSEFLVILGEQKPGSLAALRLEKDSIDAWAWNQLKPTGLRRDHGGDGQTVIFVILNVLYPCEGERWTFHIEVEVHQIVQVLANRQRVFAQTFRTMEAGWCQADDSVPIRDDLAKALAELTRTFQHAKKLTLQ